MATQPAAPAPPAQDNTPDAGAHALHDVALNAERALEQLATALGQAQAPPPTIQAVTKMADVARSIVSAIGHSTQGTAPPAPEQAPQQHTFGSASHSLQNDMRASAQAQPSQ